MRRTIFGVDRTWPDCAFVRRVFRVAAIAALILLPPGAAAQGTNAQAARGSRPDPSPSPQTADTQNRPAPGLLGDLGGVRPFLRDRGIELLIRYASESAYNPVGGARHLYRETGQFDVGATVDMARLAAIEGGTFQATITYRRGHDLGAAADLGVLQQVQEVYGRGQTWRLTQFWYEQTIGAARLKFGRSSPGEDFEGFSCHFENLSFCGAQPGNIVGDYWYNWPVSQWSARLRLARGDAFVQLGAYEVNPRNLRSRLFDWHFHGATGVLIPAELGSTGTSPTGHVWSYRVGGWWTSSNAGDVRLDRDRRPLILTGQIPLQRSSRYGAWLSLQRQLTGRSANGKSVSGLSLFLNVTQADRLTSTIDNQIALGIFYKGLFAAHPGNVLGLALARTNVNGRAARGIALRDEGVAQDAEYAAELYYSLHPLPWLELRPNLQGIHHPGGRTDAHDVAVIGLKAAATL